MHSSNWNETDQRRLLNVLMLYPTATWKAREEEYNRRYDRRRTDLGLQNFWRKMRTWKFDDFSPETQQRMSEVSEYQDMIRPLALTLQTIGRNYPTMVNNLRGKTMAELVVEANEVGLTPSTHT